MTKLQQPEKKSSFLFQVEIMVEDHHHATALEQLLRGLNEGQFPDYRITSGVKLGELIESRLAENDQRSEIPVTLPAAKPAQPSQQPELPGFESLKNYKKNNTLIRLIINKGLGIKLNIPCRIINIDETEQLITVYHVDEKQVYTFRLTEIEDLIE